MSQNTERPIVAQQVLGIDVNLYCMLMNGVCFFSFSGLFFVMLFLWHVGYEKDERIDRQGRVIANGLLTGLVLFGFSTLLSGTLFAGSLNETMNDASWLKPPMSYLLTGLAYVSTWSPLLVGLWFFTICPIVGAVRAYNGIIWKYPLSFPFFPISTPARP
ncbi:MAG: DUF4870 domain-containing protein [Thermoguttaceae bacterium]